ncbi:uncharacterized protein LOC142620773 [Castanea sativa]|uniref:uncharacterized protein LOC142620773 n=1 Tax=Castanea sativa TaxID=21020 RepID=UPI003F64B616
MPDDRQVWAETSNGIFSIRSAYKLTLELETNREIGSCSDGSNIWFWKRLWSIQIPHKIRHFAWRAAHDILPIKENLSIFTLPSLIPFWIFFEFLWHILMDAQWVMEDAGLTVTIAWALWTNRNEVIHGKLRKTGPLLVDWCRSYLEEYWATSNTPLTQLTEQTQVEVKWSPPIFPLYKINVDVAIFSAQKAAVHNTTKEWENAKMVESGPYTWSGCEQGERKRWLRDFVLVYTKGVTVFGRE